MPEFEIYPRNLRRHKNKQTNKQAKVTEQNSPVFALKIDLLAQQQNLESSLKGKQIKKRSESFYCVHVLQFTWTNSHLVLVEK